VSALDELRRRLAETSPETRRRAVRDLAELPVAQAIPLAFVALGDDDWRVRKEAVTLLGAMEGAVELGTPLLAAIEQEENVGLRNAAAEVLAQLSGPAIDLVVSRLPALVGTARKIALEVIGRSEDPRRAQILVAHLACDDVNLSAGAAELLGDLGGEEAIAALSRCLARPEQMLVLAAMQSLNRLGARIPFDALEPLVAIPVYGADLVAAFGHSGDPAAVHVILARVPADSRAARALVVLHESSTRAATAVEGAIGSADAAVLEALAVLAASGDFAVRQAAVACLLWARRTEHVPLLVELAQNEALHARIVEGFAAWGAPVVGALDAMLPRVQGRTLASVIGLMGRLLDDAEGGRRIALFTAFLNSADLVVATAALGALGRFGDGAIVPRMLELALSDQERVRRAAASALAQLGRRHADAVRAGLRTLRFADERGVELLGVFQSVGLPEDAAAIAAALTSPFPALRRAALGALAAVGGGDSIGVISLSMTDEQAEVREAAVAALAKVGTQAAETIVSALHTSEGPLRAALVRALGRVGHPEAASILSRTARESAQTAIASLEAAVSLGLDTRKLKGELLAHEDAEVVKKVLTALDDSLADAEIVPFLSSRAWDVRLAAVERLAPRAAQDGPVAQALRAAATREDDDLVRSAIERALERGRGGRR
jgi:HEAT repeat protein